MGNYRFETLQLHVGQEQPDPATDSRAVPIIRPLLMYLKIQHMRQHVLVWQMPVTFTDV